MNDPLPDPDVRTTTLQTISHRKWGQNQATVRSRTISYFVVISVDFRDDIVRAFICA